MQTAQELIRVELASLPIAIVKNILIASSKCSRETSINELLEYVCAGHRCTGQGKHQFSGQGLGRLMRPADGYWRRDAIWAGGIRVVGRSSNGDGTAQARKLSSVGLQ